MVYLLSTFSGTYSQLSKDVTLLMNPTLIVHYFRVTLRMCNMQGTQDKNA